MLGSDTQTLGKSSESKVFLCGLVGKRAEQLLCEYLEFLWSSFMIGVETRENEEQDKFVFLVVRNRHEATAPVLRDGEDICVRASLFFEAPYSAKDNKDNKDSTVRTQGSSSPLLSTLTSCTSPLPPLVYGSSRNRPVTQRFSVKRSRLSFRREFD